MKPFSHGFLVLMIAAITMLLHPFIVLANPIGGKISAGQAAISESGKTLDVVQQSPKAVIDWRGFDIAKDEITQFHQPSSNAVILNRVDGKNASQIMGKLKANGNVVISNPNGVLFSKDSIIDVNGIIATTARIGNDDFMHGNMKFNAQGELDAAIINEGNITAAEAGLVGFVAPNVLNSGTIVANFGKVQLASGDTMTHDLYGDNLMEVAISNKAASQLVSNSGIIKAIGGKVALTAAAGRDIVNSLISVDGEVHAPSISQKNGEIFIHAKGGTTSVNGTLNATGHDAKGGTISVLADNVRLVNNALVDASGELGGGLIKIGGDYLGKGDTPTAKYAFVDRDVAIYNDAVKEGNGGKTIVWSDNTTEFYGNIYARGGANSGNGGFVETSGSKKLNAKGFVDVTAGQGKRGEYLLDPTNISVRGNFLPTSLTNNALWLDASNIPSVGLIFLDIATTANGTKGTHTITMSSDKSAFIFPGAKFRLDATDVYTVDSIAGSKITTVEALSATYAAAQFFNAAILTMDDQSTGGSGSVGQTSPFDHGLFYGIGQNNNYVLISNGNNWLASTSGPKLSDELTAFSLASPNSVAKAAFGETIWGSGDNTGQAFNMEVNRTPAVQGSIWDNSVTNTGTIPLAAGKYYILEHKRSGSTGKWDSNLYLNGALDNATATAIDPSNNNSLGIVALSDGIVPFSGEVGEIIAYDRALADFERQLIEQYQSAKWDIAIVPPGAGATELQKATAANGYSDFTVSYLKRLSATADIVLQAASNISFDFNGDNLSLPSNRSISFLTTNGNISSSSVGAITTSRTTTGGNITMTAGGTGAINLTNFSLNAQNGGVVSLTSGGSMTLSNIQAGKISAHSTGVASDLIIAPSKVLTASGTGDALVLASGRNFINNAGSGTLSAPNGRWLVYSTNPANDVTSGLSPNFRRFNCTFGGVCLGLATGSGNGLLYKSVPVLTATPTTLRLSKGAAVPSLLPYAYTLSGYLAALDASTDIVTGSLNGTTNYIQGAGPGSYQILYSSGSLSSDIGYSFLYANNANGIVIPALIPPPGGIPDSILGSLLDPVPNTTTGPTLRYMQTARADTEKANHIRPRSRNSIYLFDGMLELDSKFANSLGLDK